MDKITSKIGVVTVTYNSGEVIDDFMQSMLSQSHENFILYVVDNASTDNTLERLKNYNDTRIVIIPNGTNVGVAAGNNQGIKESLRAECSHVLLINNDTVFDKDLMQYLLKGLQEHQCDITVPKMMYHDNPNVIWFAGGYFNKWKLYGNEHIGMDEIDQGQYDKVSKIEYAPTCCMMLKSSVFEKIGLMDERYFVYYDDVDFCMRALQNKVTMRYLPKITLFHKVSSLCGGSESDFTLRYTARNRVYYVSRINMLFLLFVPFYLLYRPLNKLVLNKISFQKVLIVIGGILDGYRCVFKRNYHQ